MSAERPTCASCVHYQNGINDTRKGRCRIRAPHGRDGWPLVEVTDWCGEHKPTLAAGHTHFADDKLPLWPTDDKRCSVTWEGEPFVLDFNMFAGIVFVFRGVPSREPWHRVAIDRNDYIFDADRHMSRAVSMIRERGAR
jgi:hypothetical protein